MRISRKAAKRASVFISMVLAILALAGIGSAGADSAEPQLPRQYVAMVPGAGNPTGPTTAAVIDGILYIQDTIESASSVANIPGWPQALAGGNATLEQSSNEAAQGIVDGFLANEYDPNNCLVAGHSLGGIGARKGSDLLVQPQPNGEAPLCNHVTTRVTGTPVGRGSIMDNLPDVPAVGLVIPDGANAQPGVSIETVFSQADCFAWAPNFLEHPGSIVTCGLGAGRDHYNLFLGPGETPRVYGVNVVPDVEWTEDHIKYGVMTSEVNPTISFINFVGSQVDPNFRADQNTINFVETFMPMRDAAPVDPNEPTIRGLVQGTDGAQLPSLDALMGDVTQFLGTLGGQNGSAQAPTAPAMPALPTPMVPNLGEMLSSFVAPQAPAQEVPQAKAIPQALPAAPEQVLPQAAEMLTNAVNDVIPGLVPEAAPQPTYEAAPAYVPQADIVSTFNNVVEQATTVVEQFTTPVVNEPAPAPAPMPLPDLAAAATGFAAQFGIQL